MTSKCGKNENVAHEAIAKCVTDGRTPHFDVFCDLLLSRRTATRYLLVLCSKETDKCYIDITYTFAFHGWIISKTKCVQMFLFIVVNAHSYT